MSRYTLPSGRVVHLSEFRLRATYSGHLEGSPETLTPHMLRERLREARGKALAVLPPPAPFARLPDWECRAVLTSHSAVRTRDPDYASRLEVVWWVGDTARSLDALVGEVLPRLDWEAQAEDYGIMP